MNYNFNQVIPRIGTSCGKWDSKEVYRTKQVIPMWVADMDFPVAEPIMKCIRKRAEHPVMGYAHRGKDFSEITSQWMEKRHGWYIEPGWVTFSPGMVPAISAAIQALTKPGEGVLIQPPVYYPFSGTVNACKRKLVENPLKVSEGKYRMDYEDLEAKFKTENVRLMILCNPHNPVGRVYTKEELWKLGELCLKYNVLIFSDEIHSDLILKGHRHTPLASLSGELSQITLTGVTPSKTFNLAGLQTSAVICKNQKLRRDFDSAIRMNGIQFPNIFGLEAFKSAYTEGQDYLEQLLVYLESNYTYCKRFFAQRLKPLRTTELEGTYLLWFDCRELQMDCEKLDGFMLNQAHLGLDSGYLFGNQGRDLCG